MTVHDAVDGPGPVVCVSGRGGCGATLVAGALALLWARADRRTLLIDLDLARGDIAASWGVPAERSLADLTPVLGELTPAHVGRAAFPHGSGVSLLTAPATTPPGGEWTASAGERLMTIAGDGWQRVAADLGSGDARVAAGAMAAAGRVVVVCPPTLTGARRARVVCDRLEALGAAEAMRIVVGPVSPASELSARAFGRACGLTVTAALPDAPEEARNLLAGRWSGGRRRRLAAAVAELEEALA